MPSSEDGTRSSRVRPGRARNVVRPLCYVVSYGNRRDSVRPGGAPVAVRLQLVPAGPGAGRRSASRRPLGTRRVSHRSRQEPLLSAAGPDARRRHRRRLAADCPDEGSDRRPRPPGSRRGTARFEHRAGRGTRRLRPPPRRQLEAPVRRTRALQQRALPRPAGPHAHLAVCSRRGPLHLRMGTQLPAGLPQACGAGA